MACIRTVHGLHEKLPHVIPVCAWHVNEAYDYLTEQVQQPASCGGHTLSGGMGISCPAPSILTTLTNPPQTVMAGQTAALCYAAAVSESSTTALMLLSMPDGTVKDPASAVVVYQNALSKW